MTRFETITLHMDRQQKAAATKGFAAAMESGENAANPFHKLAESKKWAAWQTGYEIALLGQAE